MRMNIDVINKLIRLIEFMEFSIDKIKEKNLTSIRDGLLIKKSVIVTENNIIEEINYLIIMFSFDDQNVRNFNLNALCNLIRRIQNIAIHNAFYDELQYTKNQIKLYLKEKGFEIYTSYTSLTHNVSHNTQNHGQMNVA